jgi:predicted porin
MKKNRQRRLIGLAAVASVATAAHAPAFAQNSVTLYGIVDNGIGYQSSSTTLGSTSGGHSAFKMITGVWAGSRFGLKGAEDLGGGT